MKLLLMNFYLNFIQAAGISGLWDTIKTNWVAPLFFAAIAIFALMFIKDKAWTKLLSFAGIAAVVGVLIFAGEGLFGNSGTTKKLVEKEAKKIKTATIVSPVSDLPKLTQN